jgi:hypothetical protein
MRSGILPVILALASVGDAAAQQPSLAPGQRVRVTIPALGLERHADTFVALRNDSIVLDSVTCALSNLTRLDRYRGRGRKTWKGALIGAGSGVALGALIGLARGGTLDMGAWGKIRGVGVMAVFAAAFGETGAVVGLIVGSTLKGDRWQRVPLGRVRVSVAPTRNGIGVGASIGF